MSTFTVVLGLAIIVLSIWVAYERRQNSTANVPPPASDRLRVSWPVRKDGVIFVTDGAKGDSRLASIELAKHGYHVLVGCKTDAEIRSFAFDARKGLELIKFDLVDPSTFVGLIYRLRQIRRDLDRPIVGIILNLAEYLQDYAGEPSTDYLNIITMDRHYKALFKGPVRLLQSIFELLRHYQNEADTSNARLLPDQTTANITLGQLAVVDTQGLRITTLYGEYAPTDGMDTTSGEYISLCGNKCDMQAGFLNYLSGFRAVDSLYTNFTIANVRVSLVPADAAAQREQYATWSAFVTGGDSGGKAHSGEKGLGSAATVDLVSPRGEKAYDEQVRAWRLQRVQRFTHSHVKWTPTVGGGSGGTEDAVADEDQAYRQQTSRATKAIMHSFLSQHPEEFY